MHDLPCAAQWHRSTAAGARGPVLWGTTRCHWRLYPDDTHQTREARTKKMFNKQRLGQTFLCKWSAHFWREKQQCQPCSAYSNGSSNCWHDYPVVVILLVPDLPNVSHSKLGRGAEAADKWPNSPSLVSKAGPACLQPSGNLLKTHLCGLRKDCFLNQLKLTDWLCAYSRDFNGP